MLPNFTHHIPMFCFSPSMEMVDKVHKVGLNLIPSGLERGWLDRQNFIHLFLSVLMTIVVLVLPVQRAF